MLASKLLSCVGGEETLYSDSVFSAFTYTGNGSTQTITNGIDLAGNGGLVWIKGRSVASRHYLADTDRGIEYKLSSNLTNAQTINGTVGSLSSTGFGLSGDGTESPNESGQTFVSWTFRKSPKFFDVVTYTGNGTPSKTISHSLASTPGMVLVKATSTTSDWYTWHRGTTSGNYLKLNTTDAQSSTLASTYFGNGTTTVDPTASNLTVGLGLNMTGVTYVVYIFAHDSSGD